MPEPVSRPRVRRADAQRNRERILAAARAAFADPDAEVSMAEVARRAGVGMATLYRNFPGRHELLEALYVDEVDALCAAAGEVPGDTPGARLEAWLRRFVAWFTAKHAIAGALLEHTDRDNPVFEGSRARVVAAGAPLLAAAQEAGDVRDDLTLDQVLDLIVGVAGVRGDPEYLEPLLRTVFDGLQRRSTSQTSTAGRPA
ncbi:MAG TPA: TetR/AcrR family transcriptional regulator [Capillimicrobium sp.]|nr:TetR/AcrR family transcriptional regulator [Capillimicrobium sp.]